jgi:hypothetical protein
MTPVGTELYSSLIPNDHTALRLKSQAETFQNSKSEVFGDSDLRASEKSDTIPDRQP